MREASAALICLVCASAGAAAAEGSLLLDERAYFRHYYRLDWDVLSPEPLKAEGQRLLGRQVLARLERDVKGRLRHLNVDWKSIDWRDRAAVRFVCPNAGIQPAPEAERFMNSPPPPADWMKPAFDDSAWPRQRKPFLVGRPSVGFGVQNCGVRAAYLRTRFFVPDPSKTGGLTLRLAYRGGVRVFVNGREVARGHLPASAGPETGHSGRVGARALAESYPLDAYIRRLEDFDSAPEDTPYKSLQRIHDAAKQQVADGAAWPLARYMQAIYVPEIFGRFEDAPKVHGKGDVADAWGNGRVHVSHPLWERVQALRERVLGPVPIPPAAVRRGENVLAIEVRAAPFHPVVCVSGGAWFGWHNSSWPHVQLSAVQLRAGSADVPSMRRRPEGVQVWVEDPHHQVHDTEWADRGSDPGTVRFTGARGGTYGAQVVVGYLPPGGQGGEALRGLAVEVSDLRQDGGVLIPASALRALPMKPVPVSRLSSTIGGRSKTASDPMLGAMVSLQRHGLADPDRLGPQEKRQRLEQLHIFDQIGAGGPTTVPPDRCQPVWIRLRVPDDAAAGIYRGTLTVRAEGVPAASLPMEAEVVNWRLPRPDRQKTLMALEFSPYAVARQYGVPLWSDDHYRLVAASLKLLGRVGNGFVFVPVLHWTEFGNRDDSPVRWIQTADGRLSWDYSRLDRLLDLAEKHMGPLRCVVFVVMHGNPGNPAEVGVLEEATGRTRTLPLNGPELTEPQRRRIWGRFAVTLLDHMKARGQEKAMHWGYAWDTEGDPMLKEILKEFTPGVSWAMGGHDIRVDPAYYKVTSWIYKVHGSMALTNNRRGWTNPRLEFLNPRGGGSVLCLPGPFPSFAYRLAVDRALTAGCRGLARIGVDYWQGTYFDGARGGEVYCQPGMPVHAVFWPGPDGAESSSRFEALAEGVQEAEARIFIEQTLDRQVLPKDLAARAESAVFDHLKATSFIPAGVPAEQFIEYGAFGWRARSRRLYQSAAEVAGAVALDVAETTVAADLAPRSKATLELTLRNWTPRPRAWTARSDQPWIVPLPAAGKATGFQTLEVVLDGFAAPPGKASRGSLAVTDAGSGRTCSVALEVNVRPVFEVSIDRAVFNVPVGGAEQRQFSLVNHSGADLRWRAASAATWIEVRPAGGVLPPGKAVPVTIACRAAGRKGGLYETAVTVAEEGADAARRIELKAYLIPPYRRPSALPGGLPLPLQDVKRKFLKSHEILAFTTDRRLKNWMWHNDLNKPRVGEAMYLGYDAGSVNLKDLGRAFGKALWVRPQHVSVYRLQGSGITTFAAWVGLPKGMDRPDFHRDAELYFEVHVDGKLRAHSGRMTVTDEPRLLVADSLAGAGEVMLVTRLANLKDSPRCLVFWADPVFYTAGKAAGRPQEGHPRQE